jgi:D-alanyl-D-alanine carboxypeptidase
MTNTTRAILGVGASLMLLFHASSSCADPIDNYIRAEMANQRLPGVALAVIRDGHPVKVKTYGLANVELNVPVTPDTEFRIASVSKQIIAIGVMLLVSDGKMKFTDSICQYLEDCPESWRGITIRHVLTHTSGLMSDAPGYNRFEINGTDSADSIRKAYAVPVATKPGEKWAYSNLGYAILTVAIQVAAAEPWAEFIDEHIFKPLHMSATRTTDMIDIVPHRASGYLYRDDRFQNAIPLFAFRASGAFLSTLEDMIKWDAALAAGPVITPSMRNQMWTPATLTDGTSTGYGFGWWIDEVGGHRRVRHGGSNPGWRSEISRFVDDRLDVIVLVNGDNARPDAMAVEVANHFIPGLSPERKTITLKPTALAEYAGRYQVTPSNIVTIAIDGPGLSIQSSEGGAEVRMLPETPSVFFISKDESYVFTREAGKVSELEIRFGTASMVGATEAKARRLP